MISANQSVSDCPECSLLTDVSNVCVHNADPEAISALDRARAALPEIPYSHSRRNLAKLAMGRGFAKATGRKSLVKVNKAVFYMAGRALGLFNYENLDVSGEINLIQRHLTGLDRPVVLDIGAFRGAWTAEVLKANPTAQVHAFEPLKGLAEEISQAQAVAAAHPVALGNTEELRTLYDEANNPNSHHSSVVPGMLEIIYELPSAGSTVSVRTVDDYCRENSLEHVEFVKIDVEGFEYEVLEGARELIRRGVTTFQFEFSEMSLVARRFLADYETLLGPGYELFRLLPDGGLLPLSRAATSHWQREQFVFQTVVAVPQR